MKVRYRWIAIGLLATLISMSHSSHGADRDELPIKTVLSAVKVAGPATTATGPVALLPPEDPCLPESLYDWEDFSANADSKKGVERFRSYRIIVDRSDYLLIFEGLHADGSAKEIYRTHVGLGAEQSLTPVGHFLINHMYCYPDVLFVTEDNQKISALYEGFLAPLLFCDEEGKCSRYRQLGIHGFDPSAHPDPSVQGMPSDGPVSAGCIRVPDPCLLKSLLTRYVGLGPVKKNERGSYHWFKRPVDVFIVDNDFTIFSIVRSGLQGLMGLFSE